MLACSELCTKVPKPALVLATNSSLYCAQFVGANQSLNPIVIPISAPPPRLKPIPYPL